MSDRLTEGSFNSFAEHLAAYVGASARLRNRALGTESRVLREIEEHPELPMRQAWVSPSMILAAAEDHLMALAAVIVAPNVALSVLTTGRLATELSSLAYWLLEPTLTPKRRAARYFAHRLDDANRLASMIMRNRDLFDADAVRITNNELNDVKKQIKKAGLTGGKEGRSTSVGGEKLPEATQRAGLALGEHDKLGPLLYEQASGIVHGRESSIRSFLAVSDTPSQESGVRFATLRVTSDQIALAMAAACLPHHDALRFLVDARGQLIESGWEESFQRLYWATIRPHLTDMPVDGTPMTFRQASR